MLNLKIRSVIIALIILINDIIHHVIMYNKIPNDISYIYTLILDRTMTLNSDIIQITCSMQNASCFVIKGYSILGILATILLSKWK